MKTLGLFGFMLSFVSFTEHHRTTAAGQDTTGILKDEGCNGGRNLGTSEPRGASGPWIFRLQRQLHCKARDLESLLKLVPGAEAAAVEDTSCLVLGRSWQNHDQQETS